jgi:hypothetical protein
LKTAKDRLNMSFTRVEQDGVEFYTLKSNGASGMSTVALARLCGVERELIRKVLKRLHGTKTTSQWLNRVVGKPLYLVPELPGMARIIRADVCFAIAGYYAFESDQGICTIVLGTDRSISHCGKSAIGPQLL